MRLLLLSGALAVSACGSDVQGPPLKMAGFACKADSECAPPAKCGGGGQHGVCGCTFYSDNDHDQYGNPANPVVTCTPPAGFVLDNTDCNDEDPTMNPGRTEVCDYKDNNCNGLIDEGVQTTYYRDADGDGYGASKNTILSCEQPGGFLIVGGDCDDSRPDVHPGAVEICDGIDNNCDGIIDGIQRLCTNPCGMGMETCVAAIWGGCTAPPLTLVPEATTLTLDSPASFACLQVKGDLLLGPDVSVSASGWVRIDSTGTVEAGPRSKIVAAGDLSIVGASVVNGTELDLTAGGVFTVESSARVYLQGSRGVHYSGGGAAACSDGTGGGSGGAGGGARGGSGGAGGSCGLIRTGPVPGAGGAAAANGAAGCSCVCSAVALGGPPSGGGGGAPMAGGGGGGSGGAGGAGSAGMLNQTSMSGGGAGAADAMSGIEPTSGGSGGGSGGTAFAASPPCIGAGGAGGGLLRVSATSFVNRGILVADGADGQDVLGSPPQYTIGGGGGGGGGGSLIFHVGRFDSSGLISAQGGRGGNGNTGSSSGATCATAGAGGGGGGGGGRVYIAGSAGGAATVVSRGSLLVAGGASGSGSCAQVPGQKGEGGWTHVQ